MIILASSVAHLLLNYELIRIQGAAGPASQRDSGRSAAGRTNLPARAKTVSLTGWPCCPSEFLLQIADLIVIKAIIMGNFVPQGMADGLAQTRKVVRLHHQRAFKQRDPIWI